MILLFLVALLFLVINIVPQFYTKRYTVLLTGTNEADKLNYKHLSKVDDNTHNAKLLKEDRCEVIHIGIVCSGYNANLYLHSLLKSIYFYRDNPIHFHIIVTKQSRRILQTLFNSWNVPQVDVTFYNQNERILDDIRWIPNNHYSGIHGMVKLTFPKLIPLHVTKKLLVLDVDLTVVSNIYELWMFFRKFNKKQAIGLVENQSDYYLGQNAWPAINRGFNSGVVMYNLEILKRLNWSMLWLNLTRNAVHIHGSTQLADQDILNLVLKEHPDLLYEVPCGWNTQLSDHTKSYDCYKYSKVKIVHWNSPKKHNVHNRDGDYFRSLATGIEHYNGNLFRKSLQFCDKTTSSVSSDSDGMCSEFHNLPQSRWRTLLYFWDYGYTPVKDDITFIAQLSYDRLHRVEELVKCWSGPISFTIYVSDHEFANTVDFIKNSEVLNNRMNVAYHAVFKDGDYYPINTLRNVGLKNGETPFVFLADVDFVPSQNLYDQLKEYVSSEGSMRKKALVVPAFETSNHTTNVPKNKMELLSKLSDKSVLPFLSHVWASGHVATDYEKWKVALEPYKVKWKPDYEPYIVVERDVVQYDERFVGFGWNKVSHIMELEAQNYEFLVLPDVFIVHKPHAPSYDIARFRKSPVYRMCLQILKEEFIQKLNEKYNRMFVNSNSSVNILYDYIRRKRRRKRNYNPSESHTTVETNTDYPSLVE